jgi:hypothetical protein
MMNVIARLMSETDIVRRALRVLLRRLRFGSWRFRYRIGALERMSYAYIVYEAARLAARLGVPSISVLELGVAGGNGLTVLERHAEAVERLFPVRIEVYGLDSGCGLPPPRDHRDLPYHWREGFFVMDREALEARLRRARLVIGALAETIPAFFDRHRPAPIGALAIDLDYYSSTTEALRLLEADEVWLMPRIFCHFDDTIGDEQSLYCEFTGERLAIDEFNRTHETRKIGVPPFLRVRGGAALWPHQIWVAHLFDHRHYSDFTSEPERQLPLR